MVGGYIGSLTHAEGWTFDGFVFVHEGFIVGSWSRNIRVASTLSFNPEGEFGGRIKNFFRLLGAIVSWGWGYERPWVLWADVHRGSVGFLFPFIGESIDVILTRARTHGGILRFLSTGDREGRRP